MPVREAADDDNFCSLGLCLAMQLPDFDSLESPPSEIDCQFGWLAGL